MLCAHLWSSAGHDTLHIVSHVGGMFIHEDEERHGPGVIPQEIQVLDDAGITSVIEEGPHVNDVLMRRELTESIILILIILSSLQ